MFTAPYVTLVSVSPRGQGLRFVPSVSGCIFHCALNDLSTAIQAKFSEFPSWMQCVFIRPNLTDCTPVGFLRKRISSGESVGDRLEFVAVRSGSGWHVAKFMPVSCPSLNVRAIVCRKLVFQNDGERTLLKVIVGFGFGSRLRFTRSSKWLGPNRTRRAGHQDTEYESAFTCVALR